MPSSLALAYQRRHALLALDAARAVGRAWGEPAAEFARTAAAIDAGSHAQAVALADAYMAMVLGESPMGVDPGTVGRQVDRKELWERPAKHARMAHSTAVGLIYAQQLVRTNVQLAARDTWHQWTAGNERVGGYRRVLGAGKNCELCITASTQRYHRDDLQPIHSSCGCTTEPISEPVTARIVDGRPLSVGEVDDSTRDALESAGLAVEDLPPVVVRQHGELGPVLTDARHAWTGPEDLAA